MSEPNREIIASYFNPNAQATSSVGHENVASLSLVDYIVYKSKLNCNYIKLIELIHRACENVDEEHYGVSKKIDVNFYTVKIIIFLLILLIFIAFKLKNISAGSFLKSSGTN